MPTTNNHHNLVDASNTLQKGFHYNQITLIIVNGTSSNRTNLDNKTTAVNNLKNLVLVNGIVPDATAAKTGRNYWLTAHAGSSADKQMPDDSTYHGTCPLDSVNDVQH